MNRSEVISPRRASVTQVDIIQPGFAEYRLPLIKGLAEKYDIRYHSLTPLSSKNKRALTNLTRIKEYNRSSTTNSTFLDLFSTLHKSDTDVIISSISDSPQSIVTALVCRMRSPEFVLWSEEWRPRVSSSITDVGILGTILKRQYTTQFVARSASALLLPHKKWRPYWCRFNVNEDGIYYTSQCSLDYSTWEYEDIRSQFNAEDKTIVLYLGRIIERKGLDILIKSCRKLEQMGEDIFLLIAGDGPFREKCERLVDRISFSNVHFSGHIPMTEIPSYYYTADVFVLPSVLRGHYEPYGLTVNESMSLSTPVITTNAVGAAEWMVRNGETGFVVSEGDEEELREALKEFIENKNKSSYMGEKARDLYEKYNNYGRMVNGFQDGIEYALNHR